MAYKKLHPNGRDKGKKGSMSQITTEMQESVAFATLNASSIRVLLFAIFLNYYAATRSTGRPVFKFTNKTAKERLYMNQQTFTRAKQELADKGFWKWVKRGGLGWENGIASEFTLLGEWKAWTPTPKQKASHVNVTGSSHAHVTGANKSTPIQPQTSHANVTAFPNNQSRPRDTINSITR